ncbi:carboxylesterase/lipase family protein [Fulvivirga ligni]|uniref:carboxylesterase/lipase family protein n=1 Tax=Fulvivirga ligni TaxID=2904246 RepID=UPI001F42F3C5|nr:carboxylesterase family protein [Fulvivirga ligni]UII19137.1 carboxylesterase family protein [Fulvivirga ligni]
MNKQIITTVLCFIISITFMQAQNNDGVQVKIANGKIEGFHDANMKLDRFFGIPFAQPPVGDLRWKEPQPVKDWKGVLETKKFGPTPMQLPAWWDMIFRADKMSEDCLYLNVWTPSDRKKANLPVLLYFYGGGYASGGGSEARYDGARMAQEGIVVVTVNYRVNVFGFMAHPELSQEASYKASGNYGLLDQLAGLKWVYENIKAFGGDPNHITIAGESAGSIAVSTHMASPLSKDMLAGAIGESGAGINPTLPPVSLKEGEDNGKEFVEAAGYKSIKEMRALSAEELLKLYQTKKPKLAPVVDNYFLPDYLPEIYEAGQQAQIPLLVGWNSAELNGEFLLKPPYSEENYKNKIKELYPEKYEDVLKLYGYGSEKEIAQSATALISDRFISYSTWKWFDLQRKHSDKPVYRYYFDQPRPKGGPEQENPKGAPHASEIPYCMGNLYLVDIFKWTEDDRKTSDTMMTYFANFIKTGNPNGEGVPEWPVAKADDKTPPVMILKPMSEIENAQHDDRYEFLDVEYGNKK